MSDSRRAPTSGSWVKRYARGLLLTDTLVVLWSLAATHGVWLAEQRRSDLEEAAVDSSWILASAVFGLAWILTLTVTDSRDAAVIGGGPEEYKRTATATLVTFGTLSVAGGVLDFSVPRAYLLVALPLGLILLIGSRWTWRQSLLLRRRRGRSVDSVLVVGSRMSTAHLIETLHRRWESGYRVSGVCLTGLNPDTDGVVAGVPVVGDVDDLVAKALELKVAAVVVASSDHSHPTMVQSLGWELESHDIDLMVAPALTDIAGPRLHIRPVAGVPLLHVERPRYRGAHQWTKTVFDRAGALAGLIALSPLLIVVALLVKATSRGPAFFIQDRVGLGGKTFGMVKFRSMVDGAEAMLGDLASDGTNERLFKMRSDPRITKVGRLLRRYSIDELPQLFNVLVGDMSLVGPRPPLKVEVEVYEAHALRRLLVRPGITGPWQVSGRSDLGWEETMRLDLYYVENWSIVSDLLILAKTIRAVVSSKGAY